MTDMNRINAQELEQVAGGASSAGSWKWVIVTGTKHYLAIRTAPTYDDKNEIGKVYNGTKIQIRPDVRSGAYVWAYASTIDTEGWVNGSYVQ